MPASGSELLVDALVDHGHPLKAATAAWAAEALHDPHLAERDRQCRFWFEGWARLAEHGVLGIAAPEAHGGQQRPLGEQLLILEGLGYGCEDNGLAFAASAQLWSAQNAIQRFGTEEQKARYLAPMVAGDLRGAFCMSEPDSGSDAFALAAVAERRGGRYVLNGHKAWATLAPVADVFVVFASTDPSAGQWGVTAFLVDASTAGLSAAGNQEKMGWRTTPFGDVRLEDCVVDASCRLGPEGAGAAIFSAVIAQERAFLFASELGATERVIDTAVRHANERRQFGHSIGEFQAVAHRIVQMRLRHETARGLMYRTALAHERGLPITSLAALTKLHATESAVATALDAIRVHGARGYVSEYGVERQARDALGGLLTSGTSDVQMNLVARLLGLG